MDQKVNTLVDHLFRHETGKMVALLTKYYGIANLTLVEDAVQDTLLAAFETWKLKGIPENPQAWLYKVAKNKMFTLSKRSNLFQTKISPELLQVFDANDSNSQSDDVFLKNEIEDAQLRMIFACCHPTIDPEMQLILILKIICGLSIKEIASALITNEETLSKRLYRAKQKIKSADITFEVPIGNSLSSRIDIVLTAIYLLFNEAYKSTSSEDIIRKDLCDEALRLCSLLVYSNVPDLAAHKSKINALMALLCFHVARFDSRMNDVGQIVLLKDQDRSLWNKFLIKQAYYFFNASKTETHLSEYHIEAAIASYHISALKFEDTNWLAIYYCYVLLYDLKPSTTIAFNKAISLGYAKGPDTGLEALLAINALENNHFYHTALGDFYSILADKTNARLSYKKALLHVQLQVERAVICTKLVALD